MASIHRLATYLAWIAAHGLAAFGLSFALAGRESDGPVLGLGVWGVLAAFVQAPFLLTRFDTWWAWRAWLLGCAGVAILSFVIEPFGAGFTFSLCGGMRDPLLAPACGRVYLLLALVPCGLIVGGLQWLLLRRGRRGPGWLVPGQIAGMVAFASIYVAMSTRGVGLDPTVNAASWAAGAAYGCIVGLTVLRVKPRERTTHA